MKDSTSRLQYTEIDDLIREAEKDPEFKVRLDLARERLRIEIGDRVECDPHEVIP